MDSKQIGESITILHHQGDVLHEAEAKEDPVTLAVRHHLRQLVIREQLHRVRLDVVRALLRQAGQIVQSSLQRDVALQEQRKVVDIKPLP